MRVLALLIGGWLALAAGPAAAVDAEGIRCLAMLAYAEAAVDGERAMAAVMRVVHNRILSPDFPDDACAVGLQAGQFQPVSERPALAAALRDPTGYSPFAIVGATSAGARRAMMTALRLARAPAAGPDLSRGALYFVNPDLMDPARCPWFAGLKRTQAIGGHVFMRERLPHEAGEPPALECGLVTQAQERRAGKVPASSRLQARGRAKLAQALARRRAEVESLYVLRPSP